MDMDINPLTPNKIRMLLNFAEDASAFSVPRRIPVESEDPISMDDLQTPVDKINFQTGLTSSSSGIIDLDHVQGFGDSQITNESLSRSAAIFNPGEMTGRSTGASEMPATRRSLGNHFLENLEANMNKQSHEVHDIMRHSIAADYSFHSKRDLTADEVSLIQREAPLPVPATNQSYFMENMTATKSNLSVGAYFNHRCEPFGKILGHTDSPDRHVKEARPSISEVSSSNLQSLEPVSLEMNNYKMDQTLDSVPVRQSRADSEISNNPPKNLEKSTFQAINNGTYCAETSVALEVPQFPKHYPVPHKVHGNKPADILRKKMQSFYGTVMDDTQGSTEASLSLTKIAEFLGNQSNISVSEMLKMNKKQENINKQAPNTQTEQVTNLRDCRNIDAASSAGTLNTVISLDKLKIEDISVPAVTVTQFNDTKRSTRSKSPSTKSQSTMSTVHENYTSFKSGDSPMGQVNTSHVRSPNVEYRELDKSVDWQEVLHQKRLKQEGLAKEKWADISVSPVHGFVGVNFAITITVSTLIDNWLTAKFTFDDAPQDLMIELPRQPLLLSPGKSEQYTVYITSNSEIKETLPFIMHLKDASLDTEIEQLGHIDLDIKMPVIQAMSSDGLNKLTFTGVQINSSAIRSFVLISDCPSDLQLVLSIPDTEMFTITSVQEIKKSDVNKALIERQVSEEASKGKSKGMHKQLCRLSSGNALWVSIKFCALRNSQQKGDTTGVLNVNLLGIRSVLRKVELIGSVGTVNLVVKMPSNKLQLTKKATSLTLCNMGTVSGSWVVQCGAPFRVTPHKFEIRPSAMRVVSLHYLGPEDTVTDTTIFFEELTTGTKTPIEVTGGDDRPKTFPIRTNHNVMSWIRTGRKELSLKNSTDKKVHIRCQIQGEGFSIDVPGVETRDAYCLAFAPGECRPLPILFAPNSNIPLAATLYLCVDKNMELSRNIKLFGCSSGDAVRWHGPVTHGDTALVRCESREQVALQLYNKSHAPAFVSARVQFSLQYNSIASSAYLVGNNSIIPPRCKHVVRLCVEWGRVERRARDAGAAAATLAAVTCLTGGEITRRRILRVLRDDASGGLDTSLLDNHLKALAGQFEGEDRNMDNMLADFKETKASLNELIGGLNELTAQIVLPQDFMDENTIIITDDTMVEYHTLCD